MGAGFDDPKGSLIMGSRILTMKKQAAELGRIRTGYSRPNPDPKKRPIPVKSETFVLTSHSRQYVEAAAEMWGGDVEAWTPQNQKIEQFRVITRAKSIDAIMPAGDPLSQSYEMWTGGGCARRCDGETEQLSRKPCLCLAQYGDDWHLRPPTQVCRPTSRINVMLPELPDLGVWRLESKSYYAADAMAGGVDAVLAATEGRSMMPVRMWIEQRSLVRDGKTKNFPVVMVVPRIPKLRHALSGPLSTAAALDPGSLVDRPAIEAAPIVVPDYLDDARKCRSADEVREVWHRANRAGAVDPKGSDELSKQLMQIAADIAKGIDPSTGEVGDQDEDELDEDGAVEGEIVEDDEPPTAYPAAGWPEVAQPGGGAR
ncbi:recombination directionality factor [Streptomyces caniferus]|uniref:recombination directionality factor n=1 Tax=Streptomyces caniferus TaxID=285557 RepID=UPI003823BD70